MSLHTPLPLDLEHADFVLLRVVCPAVMASQSDLRHAQDIARRHPDLLSITQVHPDTAPAVIKLLARGAALLRRYDNRTSHCNN